VGLLVVGSIALDSVVTPFGETADALGGAAVFFSMAGAVLHPVQVVGVVGNDFPETHLKKLAARGVDLAGVERKQGESFRWKARYSYDLNSRETLETRLGVFAEFQPRIPDKFRDAKFVFLGNIDPELQLNVLDQVKQPKLVACDTMNYWIEKEFKSLLETLKLVDILIINDAETRELAGESNLYRAGRKILSWGPRALVIKRGEYGVVMMKDRSMFGAPAYPLEDVFDPTGAGDSFAGGFVGYLAGCGELSDAAIRKAIIFGSVMASFNVEKFSLDRLRNLTFPEIQGRFREFKQLTHFEGLE